MLKMGYRQQQCVWFLFTLFLTTKAQEILDGGPMIEPTADQDTYILNQGDNITLYCNGRSNVTWTRQTAISQSDEGGFFFKVYSDEAIDGEYGSRVALELLNVNEHTVGYYACHHVDAPVDLNDIMEELNSTDEITYIYIYVKGTVGPFADMSTTVTVPENSRFVIPCRPTAPNIKVELRDMNSDEVISSERYTYKPKIGFLLEDDPENSDMYKCQSEAPYGITVISVTTQDPSTLKNPLIHMQKLIFETNVIRKLVGETIVMNCTVPKVPNVAVKLEWGVPNGEFSKRGRYSQQNNTQINLPENSEFYTSFELKDISAEDEGVYTCKAIYRGGTEKTDSIKIIILHEAELELVPILGNQVQLKVSGGSPSWGIRFRAYPSPNITVWKDMVKQVYPSINGQNERCIVTINKGSKGSLNTKLILRDTVMEDTGNYTIVFDNGYLSKNVTVEAVITENPKVSLEMSESARFLKGSRKSIACRVSGNPVPEVTWTFQPDCPQVNCSSEELRQTSIRHSKDSPYAYTSILDLNVMVSGNLTCRASTDKAAEQQTKPVLVYEVETGFGIEGADWFARGSEVWVSCIASKYDYYDNIAWYKIIDGARKKVTADVVSDNTALSYVKKLHIKRAALENAGTYECEARRLDQFSNSKNHTFVVEEWSHPTFQQRLQEGDIEGLENLDLFLNCTAEGVPRPHIRWFHNGVEEMSAQVNETHEGNKVLKSTLVIRALQEKDLGKYECRAAGGDDGDGDTISTYANVILKNRSSIWIYVSIFGVIMVVFLIVISYLLWKIRKEKRFRKQLYQQFNEGNTQGLNPKLAVDEQADLLPYDKKFEFPQDKLTLLERLGEGAFGEVYKAIARGIIDAEKDETVAVKKAKRDADSMYVKALESELKIMIHLGKHLNILNLLGACTKKIANRELMVIVEYCKFGNLQNYLQKHRDVFVDQLNDSRNHLGNGQFNRGFSRSSANSGDSSDYFGSERTPVTGHTMVNSAGTSAPLQTDGSDIQLLEFVKGSESDYVQPRWRSNYQSDYEETGDKLRPLHSTDLICWAFQIARGMEYLASRKVLHGDLAARNILLADDNVVKICDFGLARSMQKNDVYQKQSNDPVPLKWLALECIKTKTFSTQSDVWSYGVVLWELFSLGKTPYPGLPPDVMLEKLNKGERLEKPKYANDALYDVMKACWNKKPDQRPCFTHLHERIGSMLEANVRNHYVDLNSPFVASNEAWRNVYGATDYLAMLQAPEYRHDGSLCTPTPTYQNQSFFPQPVTDADGYLQVSPCIQKAQFTPRSNGDMFNFDRRQKLTSEKPKHSSEVTPMLSDDEHPHRGSDSDLESSHSPYMKMKPSSIVEEDNEEVFTENMRNNNTAVENPSYHILIEPEKEKKLVPGYVNIIPNRELVK